MDNLAEDGMYAIRPETPPGRTLLSSGTVPRTPRKSALPEKRPRRDSASSNHSMTSLRDPSAGREETEQDDPNDPFTTVIHKKTRRAGIPVILTPVDPKQSFLEANPNVIAQEVLSATQERIRGHRIAKEGFLCVTVASLPAAKALLKLTALANIGVTTRIPESYARNIGKIIGLKTPYSDELLLEFLRPVGAIHVRRQRTYHTDENGETTSRPTDSVIITFKSDIPMPEEVTLGFNTYKVVEFFSPTQCFRCQRFGHLAKNCRGPVRCKACAGPHAYSECNTKKERRCVNCNGAHASTYGGCPRRIAAVEHVKRNVCGMKPPKPGPINPAMVHPPPRPPPVPEKAKTAFPPLAKPLLPDPKPQRQPRIRSNTTTKSAQSDTPKPWNEVVSSKAAPPKAPPKPSPPAPPPAAEANAGVQLVLQIIPFLMTALKALIAAIPNSTNVPEVQKVLALEPQLLAILSQHNHGA